MGREGVRASWSVLALLVALLPLGSRLAEPLESTAPARGPDSLWVGFRDGLLSVEATDTPWATVLEEVRRKTGIALHLLRQPEATVTVSFQDLRLEQALMRLFGPGVSYIILYDAPGPRPASAAVPSKVWVLGRAPGAPAAGMVQAGGPPQGAEERPPEDRLAEVRILADEDDPGTVPRLLEALRDSNPQVRIAAAEALGDLGGELGDESVVDPLRQVLVGDKDQGVRVTAADALAELGSPKALTALGQALKDPEVVVRRSAVDAIAEIGGEEALPILREALRDEDREVRRAAGEALLEELQSKKE